MRKFFILIITSLLFSGCFEPEPPPEPDNIVKYAVETNIGGLSADIIYCDPVSDIVMLEDAALPWELELTPEPEFCGTAYLKAIISEDIAFVPYLTGRTTGVESVSLIDSSADFIASGVSAGDMIYKNPDDVSFVIIDSVQDQHTLKLKSNFYTAVDEPYNIYHLLSLTVTILHNDEIAIENTVDGCKRLESLVQSSITE